MKFAYIFVIALTLLSVFTSKRFNTRKIESPVYSMVVSAKHYNNGAEKKDFFFTVPFSFNSQMKFTDMLDTFDIDFKVENDNKGFFKFINEAAEAQKAKKKWLDVLEFQNGNKQLNVHTAIDSKYTVEIIKVYQN